MIILQLIVEKSVFCLIVSNIFSYKWSSGRPPKYYNLGQIKLIKYFLCINKVLITNLGHCILQLFCIHVCIFVY